MPRTGSQLVREVCGAALAEIVHQFVFRAVSGVGEVVGVCPVSVVTLVVRFASVTAVVARGTSVRFRDE